MTTSKGKDDLAQSALNPKIPTTGGYRRFLALAEKLLNSAFIFPLFFVLLMIDTLLPIPFRGSILLLGVLLTAGLCAEEFGSFLRSKDFPVPAALCLNAGIIPVLVAFCWRPSSVLAYNTPQWRLPPNDPALSLLTIVTLAVVFCTLMVALSLITEVSEKLVTGLVSFAFACGGSLLIGFIFAHISMLRQIGDLLAVLMVLSGGWILTAASRMKHSSERFILLSRFGGLSVISVICFWVFYAWLF